MAKVFFWIAVSLSVALPFSAFFVQGDTKRPIALLPFMFYAAAAVAQYLGI